MTDHMTKDEVLDALGNISKYFENCAKATYGDAHKCFEEWMNAADWAAVYLNDNEQEPVEPNKPGTAYKTTWSCGACAYPISTAWVACPSCGRKVKWDEAD